MTEVTAETILTEIHTRITQKLPVPESWWLNAAQKLNIFYGTIADEYADLRRDFAEVQVKYIEEGKSVAEAKTRAMATTLYSDMEKKKAKLSRKECEAQLRELWIELVKLQRHNIAHDRRCQGDPRGP